MRATRGAQSLTQEEESTEKRPKASNHKDYKNLQAKT